MSLLRSIRRSMERTDNALELVMESGPEPRTASPRMALAGNTGSGLRRRAKRLLAEAERLFQPRTLTKEVHHANGDVQTIRFLEKLDAPSVHEVARDMARSRKARS